MSKSMLPQQSLGNRLLGALPDATIRRLLPRMERVPLRHKEVLHQVGQRAEWVYFPIAGTVVSLVIPFNGSLGVEVGVAGDESIVCISAYLNGSPHHRSVVQRSGEAFRMRSGCLLEEADQSRPLRALLNRYADSLLFQHSQIAACSLHHTLPKRLSRWLATMGDRSLADTFVARQEDLARLLGVQRTGMTEACRTMLEAGLIRYRRGELTITDRKRLEASACSCYRVLRSAIAGLYC